MAGTKGKIKEVLGWATGDRRVQAEGRAEKLAGEAADKDTVKKTERKVRKEEGDTASRG